MNTLGIFVKTDALPGDRVGLQFAGTLLGQPVTWNAVLYTRERYLRDHPREEVAHHLIQVGEAGNAVRELTVVLDLPCIDAPTVQKTVRMIRQWKRLAPGRHPYGGPP